MVYDKIQSAAIAVHQNLLKEERTRMKTNKRTKHIKRFMSSALSALLLFGGAPVNSFAASESEIWQGYPAVDQLPAINTIPDPFKFFNVKNDPNGDGYVNTPAEWDSRKNEIKDIVQRYWLGYRWPTKAQDVVGEYNKDVEIPNTISIWGTNVNVRDEFDKLVEKLKVAPVVVNGTTYGPAANQAEATEMAINAWNAGYSITVKLFGWFEMAVVLKDNSGILTQAPNPTKMVKRNTVTITNPETKKKASFFITINNPTDQQKIDVWGSKDVQVPVIIEIGSVLSSTHIATMNKLGYADIVFTPTDIYPDDSTADDGIDRSGVYTTLYPYNKDVYEYASGALMAWSWGVSQIVNALEQITPDGDGTKTFGEELGIDPTKTVVTGHSRNGKAALFAGAFDDRISICLPSEPGGSGIQSNRYKVEGKIFNFDTYDKADRVYGRTEIPTVSLGKGNSWFPDQATNFANKDNQLPFDSDEIIALVAPRPFVVTTGIDAHWLGNEGGVASVQAASEVYDFIGENNIEKTNIAVRARQSDHTMYNRDIPFIVSIMDREFKQMEDKTLHVQDLYPVGDSSLNSISYPAKDYNTVSKFNSYPFEVNSSYLPWSSSNKYTLWTAQENFLVAHPATIQAHSNAPDVKLIAPDGTEFSAASHKGEVFTFNLTPDQSKYGRYELRTVGANKANRSVFFAAVSLADSLRHATSKGDEGEENRLIGFSSRLANTPSDAPLVYVGGSTTPATMSFNTNRFCAEDTTLMEYGVNFHDKLFANIANAGWDETKTFDIKNLKFVTIPGFTFEVSLDKIPASAGNNGKDLAANFTQPISWNVEKYNNGPAPVWPLIPDTKAEKDTLASGGTVSRPDAPEPKTTNFKAEVTSVNAVINGDKTDVVINFSEPMDKSQFGFGLNITQKWETIWAEDGTQVRLSVANSDLTGNSTKGELIIFRLMDTSGNLIGGPIEKTFEFPDKNAPVTKVIKDGTAGEKNWYLSDVKITLSAADNDGGIGVKNTSYSFDGIEWKDYSGPIDIKTEGASTLKYYSVDKYGNKEEIQELQIQIDKSAPEIILDQPVDGGQYKVGQQVTASWKVMDAFSGVQSSIGTLPNEGSLDTSKPGQYTFTVSAQDKAGNEQSKTVSYTVFLDSNSNLPNDNTNSGSNSGTNSSTDLPKTGSVLDTITVSFIGYLMLIMGLGIIIKRSKKID
jgi:hypothetical protein